MNEKENRGKTAGASVDAYVGRDVGYKISTDPARAERIANRTEKPPNPVDPTSIPEGTAITLDESTYGGLDLGLSYRTMRAELGYNQGHSVSAAVQRIDATHVRLTVGDADLVRSTMALAVGSDDANVSVGSEKSLADARPGRSTSTSRRRMDSGRTRVSSRRAGFPSEARGSPIRSAREGDRLQRLDQARRQARRDGGEADRERQDRPDPRDGQPGWDDVDHPVWASRRGWPHARVHDRRRRQGRPEHLLAAAAGRPRLTGGPARQQAGLDPGDGDRDVTLNFDDVDMRRMRSAAIDQLQMHNPRYSRDEIKQMVAAGDTDGLASPDRTALHIARQTNPLEIAKLVATQGGGDSAAAARWLFDFGESTTLARHGTGGHVGDHPEDAALDDPKLTAPGC